MWWKTISLIMGVFLTYTSSIAGTEEVNKKQIEEDCKKFAVEDKVAVEESEAYIQQCVQDLIDIRSQEDTLPERGDLPVPPEE